MLCQALDPANTRMGQAMMQARAAHRLASLVCGEGQCAMDTLPPSEGASCIGSMAFSIFCMAMMAVACSSRSSL